MGINRFGPFLESALDSDDDSDSNDTEEIDVEDCGPDNPSGSGIQAQSHFIKIIIIEWRVKLCFTTMNVQKKNVKIIRIKNYFNKEKVKFQVSNNFVHVVNFNLFSVSIPVDRWNIIACAELLLCYNGSKFDDNCTFKKRFILGNFAHLLLAIEQ